MKGVVELGWKPALLQVMFKPSSRGAEAVCAEDTGVQRWIEQVHRRKPRNCVPKRGRESHRSWFLTPPTPSNRPKRPEFPFTEVLGMMCCKHSFPLWNQVLAMKRPLIKQMGTDEFGQGREHRHSVHNNIFMFNLIKLVEKKSFVIIHMFGESFCTYICSNLYEEI